MTELQTAASEYHENKIMIQQLKSINENLKNFIIENMKTEVEFIGEFKATYKNILRSGFDVEAFKKDHPELYKQYLKSSNTKRFELR